MMARCPSLCRHFIQHPISFSGQLVIQAASKAEGWGVMRWITRENNYRARGLYDKLAEKTDWALYEMAAK